MARRVMIAAAGSSCGKTTITCGLLACLKRRNLRVASCKCGPDYIDTMFHSRVLMVPSGNLDGFFLDKEGLRELAGRYEKGQDILVLEGVMGYYDGIGMTSRASSYCLALQTQTPVVLIIDCKGMAASIEAVLQGFLQYKNPNMICGVIFNRLPASLYIPLKEKAEALGIVSVGYLPVLPKELLFESRHLGLVTAGEIADFETKIKELSGIMEETVSIDTLLEIAGNTGIEKEKEGYRAGEAKEGCQSGQEPQKRKEDVLETSCQKGKGLRVAVAKDEAFCFLYEDNLFQLESRGCELIYFSPLKDDKIPPDCQGLILSGGYPELYAKELSVNTSMLESVRWAVAEGICCLAECGGYLYLHKEIEGSDGLCYKMADVIDARAYRQKHLKHFGYVYTYLTKDGILGKKGDCYKAHEFHYLQSDEGGAALRIEKASGNGCWTTAYMTDTMYAGFPHFFLAGNEGITNNFIEKMWQAKNKGQC